MLHYPAAKKPKKFNKPVVEIFAKVQYLCKQLKAVITKKKDSFKKIAIVIALNMLYNDFNTTTASMLETRNKSIDEIFTIIQSKEAKYKSKRATENIDDAALAFHAPSPKRKVPYNNLCYNCHQKEHFG